MLLRSVANFARTEVLPMNANSTLSITGQGTARAKVGVGVDPNFVGGRMRFGTVKDCIHANNAWRK